ncbi:MAG: exodeoxyribonuclease VII small subunit [marine benthic group bacterium]|jgi:exodeoxyribonuclease VII small subunit|nr:exodeoxyribonuclease VII small subunit [Candidatus Benthicola marisminoris]
MTGEETSFEQLLAELEEIADSLEVGNLPLDEALRSFEVGIERLRVAAALLDAAHGRVEELVEGAAGLTIQPLDPADEDEEESSGLATG